MSLGSPHALQPDLAWLGPVSWALAPGISVVDIAASTFALRSSASIVGGTRARAGIHRHRGAGAAALAAVTTVRLARRGLAADRLGRDSMLPPLTSPVLPPSADPPRLLSDELVAVDGESILLPPCSATFAEIPVESPIVALPDVASPPLLLPLLPSPAIVLPPSAIDFPSPDTRSRSRRHRRIA